MIVNAEIILEPGQDAEQACRQLKKAMVKAGVFRRMKQLEFYRKPSEAKRIKSVKARRRERKHNGNPAEYLAHLDRAGLSDDARRDAQRGG